VPHRWLILKWININTVNISRNFKLATPPIFILILVVASLNIGSNVN
jgi:hypothetical protein